MSASSSLPEYTYCLMTMKEIYNADPVHAVRSQEFIKTLHSAIADIFRNRLSAGAKRAGVHVVEEAPVFGSYKKKDVDIAVIHPTNGPLVTVGVRSQMGSVGKNALTYYQDIIGECISLQERFPMMTMGYVYMHPLKTQAGETPNHERYAKLYASIGSRDDRLYKNQVGSYDQFAYLVVDFDTDPPTLHDEIVKAAVPGIDMRIESFVERMICTFNKRNLWLDDIFD